MPDYKNDQAAGLRRIMTGHQATIVTVLSATSEDNQPSLIANIAASISRNDGDVLIVSAQDNKKSLQQYGIASLPSLYDVAHEKSALAPAVKSSKLGFLATKLFPKQRKNTRLALASDKRLNDTFDNLASLFEVVLVDATLDSNYLLPLEALNQHEVLIQLSRDSASIQQAYLLIKQICSQVGNRSFGIIVADATDAQAATAFRSISQVARRFMQIELEFFGAIPADEHLSRAAKLGRAVIDAFPLTTSSQAFNALAQRLNYKQTYAAEAELASFV